MKVIEMNNREHMVAVVDPTVGEDSTLDLAQEVANRGGRVTVMVLASRNTVAGMSAFADSEDLPLPDAREIYLERLAAQYTERFGSHQAAATILTGSDASRFVFATAARTAATMIAMPQRLAARRGWRSSVAKSPVPVLIAPPRAA